MINISNGDFWIYCDLFMFILYTFEINRRNYQRFFFFIAMEAS